MKTYKVRLSPLAINQMAEIRDYILYQLQNPDAARNLIKKIRADMMKLDQMPERFQLVDEEPWRSRGIRKLIVRNFYAYYWVDEDSSVVYVTAVTYARRDQKGVLERMDTE
ncbi:MAG: type II toxin-antitoxin system RelE/ParE family toxin [Oscillospiraceae bacterium]|nr:type II toxin-antitoxin system RelE/ParE family toxin [Oscillospiraceae bacterium]